MLRLRRGAGQPPAGAAGGGSAELPSYLFRAADANRTLTASFSAGFDFDRSSPIVETLAIMALCSSSDRREILPPWARKIFFCSAKKSRTNGVISAVTLAPASRTTFWRSAGSESIHFLLITPIEFTNG